MSRKEMLEDWADAQNDEAWLDNKEREILARQKQRDKEVAEAALAALAAKDEAEKEKSK